MLTSAWGLRTQSLMEFFDWPENESGEERKLFHAGLVTEADAQLLTELCWTVIDLRLRRAVSDSERADLLKDWLEGIRVGSIEADASVAKFLEMEARIYGLIGNRVTAVKPQDDLSDKTVDKLLDWANSGSS